MALGQWCRLTWGLVRFASSGTPPHADCIEVDTLTVTPENSGTHSDSTGTDLQVLSSFRGKALRQGTIGSFRG